MERWPLTVRFFPTAGPVPRSGHQSSRCWREPTGESAYPGLPKAVAPVATTWRAGTDASPTPPLFQDSVRVVRLHPMECEGSPPR